jgi:hypothetical protein
MDIVCWARTLRALRLFCLFVILAGLALAGITPGVGLAPAAELAPAPAQEKLPPAQLTQVIVFSGRITRQGGAVEPGVAVELWSIPRFLSKPALLKTATVDSNGNYRIELTVSVFTLSTSQYRLIPQKGVVSFSPEERVVGGGGATGQDFTAKLPPIILLGGWTGIDLPKLECPQQRLDGSTYFPGACPNVYFGSSLRSALTGAGYSVYPLTLESSLFGTPRIVRQTSALRAMINFAKNQTGQSKVIILAHSLGGIVARRYIESSLYQNDVSHLFTFGSPHLGNPFNEDIANPMLDQLVPALVPSQFIGLVRPVINEIKDGAVGSTVNFICSTDTYLVFVPISTLPPIAIPVPVPGPGQEALCDTSVSGMTNFNLSFRPRSGVTYHLINGHATSSNLDSLGQLLHIVIPGDDDGFIQTNSMNWPGTHDRLRTGDPHAGKPIGRSSSLWYMGVNSNSSMAHLGCLKPVIIDRTEETCGTVSTLSLQELADLTPMATPSSQLIPVQSTPALTIGETITRTVNLVEDGATTFVATWGVSGTATFTLLDPTNTPINPAYAAANPDEVEYLTDGTQATYVFTNAVAGAYHMQLEVTDATTLGLKIYTQAETASEYSFTATRSRNWLPPDGEIVISAVFTGPTPITNQQVTASIARSDGVTETVSITSPNNSNYQLTYTAPDAPGYLDVTLIATGEVSGTEIERAAGLHFTIYPPSFSLDGQYSPIIATDAVTVNVGLTAEVSGAVRVAGFLVDPAGAAVARATVVTDVVTGTHTIALRFEGTDIYEAGLDGPYRLSRVLVVDEREEALVSDDQQGTLLTTAAYSYDYFATSHFVFLPVLLKP